MRIALLLLCFSLIFSAGKASDPAPSSPADTYIRTRDGYIAELKASTDPTGKRVDRAIADLETRLRAIIPPWHARGYPATGEMNLSCMDDNDLGFSVPDGLVYRAGGTSVIVTNSVLLLNWQVRHNKEYGTTMPGLIPEVFRDENFWGFAVGCDAGANLHGAVEVRTPEGATAVHVELVEFSQYGHFNRAPDALVAAVVRGDRVFIARQKLRPTLAEATRCKAAYDHATVALAGLPPTKAGQSKIASTEESAARNYRACFAVYLRTQPNYVAIKDQAQTLVDLLH